MEHYHLCLTRVTAYWNNANTANRILSSVYGWFFMVVYCFFKCLWLLRL